MFTYEFESTKLMLSFLNTKGNGLNYFKIEDFKLNPTKANLFLKDPCIHWSELQRLATQFYLPSLFESNSNRTKVPFAYPTLRNLKSKN